jgi:hypothetical protein
MPGGHLLASWGWFIIFYMALLDAVLIFYKALLDAVLIFHMALLAAVLIFYMALLAAVLIFYMALLVWRRYGALMWDALRCFDMGCYPVL